MSLQTDKPGVLHVLQMMKVFLQQLCSEQTLLEAQCHFKICCDAVARGKDHNLMYKLRSDICPVDSTAV